LTVLTSREPSVPTAPAQQRQLLALAALALPTLLVAVDISVMAVALPSIAVDLHPSAAHPLLMDRVISSSPPERAGAGAAMAQLANELGVALGLTVLGSIGTVVYRHSLGDVGETARTSVVDGVDVATARGDGGLLADVYSAFTGAYNVIGLLGLAVMVVVVVLARVEGRAPASEKP